MTVNLVPMGIGMVQAQEGELQKADFQKVGLFCFRSIMFGVYILFSKSADKFYVGHTVDVQKRLNEHNFILTDSFTAKHRPWDLMIFVPISGERKYAVRLEMAIKAKKSKVFIQKFLKYPDLRQKMVDQILLT